MRRKIVKKRPYFLIGILAVLGFSTILFLIVNNVNILNDSDNVCPDGGDWEKVEGTAPSYTVASGEIIEAVCVKGGNEPSPNEYLHTFNEDGWYTVEGENCVRASGIGTNSASASHGPAAENLCAEISHASFRVAEKEATLTNTEPPKEDTLTPTSPPDTPTPTNIVTDPPKEETPTNTEPPKKDTLTPTPTATFTEPPKETTSTPTGTITEPPKESTPTATNTEPPKEDPTSTPQSTDPPQTTPDAQAGGSGPSLGSIITLLGVSTAVVGLGTYLVSKIKNNENSIK